MVDSVGAISSVMSASASAVRVSAAASSSGSVSSSVNTSVALSPTSKVDPMSGVVITEYLSDAGEVTSQIPSTAAIAYLRVGLTASGMPVDSSTPAVMA